MGFIDGLGDVLTGAVGTFIQGNLNTKIQKDRMNTLYPGTTPWERLGVNAGQPTVADSNMAVANINARVQERAQDLQAQTARDVAKIQSAPAMKQANVQESLMASQERRNVAEAVERTYRTQGITLDNKMKADLSRFSHELAVAKLSAEQTRSIEALLMNALHGGFRDEFELLDKVGKDIPSLLPSLKNLLNDLPK